MLKFLVIILLVTNYVTVSYWLLTKDGFDTARECAQYLMSDTDSDFGQLIEKSRYRFGESWVRVFTVLYSIEIVLLEPIMTALVKIEYLFKK